MLARRLWILPAHPLTPTFLSDQPLTRIARIWVTSMTRYIWPGWFWGSQKPMWKYLCLRVYGNGWMTENSFLAAFEKIMRVRLPKFAASSIIQIAIWKSETLSYLAFCNKPKLLECKRRSLGISVDSQLSLLATNVIIALETFLSLWPNNHFLGWWSAALRLLAAAPGPREHEALSYYQHHSLILDTDQRPYNNITSKSETSWGKVRISRNNFV